jgi:hypothetical protein
VRAGLVLERRRRRRVDGVCKTANIDVVPGATDVAMTVESYVVLCDRAARELRDPFLGLHAAMAAPRGRYGLFEYILRSRATVRDAVAALGRFARLVYPQIEVRIAPGTASAHVECRIPDAPNGVGRQGNEFAIASIVKVGREASGTSLAPELVEFTHERPDDVSELERFFATKRIEFGREANRIHIGAAVLEAPFRSADPALARVLEEQAVERLPAEPALAEPMAGLRRPVAGRRRLREARTLRLRRTR